MKKVIFSILMALAFGNGFSQMTDTQLTTAATTIQNETTARANTALRVGTMLNNIISNKINNDKIDTATALGSSNTKVPSQNAVKTYVDATAGGVVYNVKVSLTSAEILQLNTTPKTLVAAPGANKIIVPLRIMMKLNYVSTTYTTNTTLVLGAGSLFSTNLSSALGFSESELMIYTLQTNGGINQPSLEYNQPLRLSAYFGNPVAGNGTLDVYLTYTIINI